ncbi:MAG: DUF3306 domain-containing protein [Pseudomonadota bacterium]
MSDIGSFWARRRAAVEAETEAEKRAAQKAQADAIAADLAEKPDSEALEALNLPDPAQMKSGDDFSGFMAREVPEHLRRQALRHLWRSNPVLACVDGLNEYDDDYRAAMLLQEPIKTAYQVGKGMLKHIEDLEQKKEALAAGPADEDIAESAPEPAPEVMHNDAPDAAYVEPDVADLDVPEDASPSPRRMRFRFEEEAV